MLKNVVEINKHKNETVKFYVLERVQGRLQESLRKKEEARYDKDTVGRRIPARSGIGELW